MGFSIDVQAVHFEVIPAVALDQRARHQGHEGDGQQLGQSPPGEDVVQGGDVREDGARAHADEVVGDQTWKTTTVSLTLVALLLGVYVCVCVTSPMSTEKKKMGMGMLRTGQVTFKNQLGVIGKKRRKRRKKNKLLRFSSTLWEGEGGSKQKVQQKDRGMVRK